jgi:sulfate permease, SulP family
VYAGSRVQISPSPPFFFLYLMLKPKFISLLKNLKDYSASQFVTDCISGIIVGIIALPLAIAFAIASGVSPEKGIITAIVGGLLVSLLSGSRVQIAGPTGAFVVIVYGIIQAHGLEGLYIATIMAGVLLIFSGLCRIGSLIKYIPYAVVVGFTSGIAVIIFLSEIKDALGLSMGNVPAGFFEKWASYSHSIQTFNPYALAMTAGTIILVLCSKRFLRGVPGSIIALVIATCAAYIFRFPIETIGSRFGEIPHHFPSPVLPVITFGVIKDLSGPILAIALLGGIESLLSAVVADAKIGGQHRPNMELIAQGVANIASPLFGGVPVTGAIARTATNVDHGARTPVAGIVHAITLLLIMLFLGKWVIYIPLACLAGILIVVAYNMSEWKTFATLCRGAGGNIIILLSTFLLTILVDLVTAITVGVLLSVLLFMLKK